MKHDLTIIYEGANLSGATAEILYLPILKTGTLETIDVLTDENQIGNAVFSVFLNGAEIADSEVTVANGSRLGSVTGLNVAVTKGDEIILNLVSGNVSAPVTLNLVVEDGATSGFTEEEIQDIVGAMFQTGANMSFNYNDATGKLELDALGLSTEEIQDRVAALLVGGANTTVTYNDGANTLTIAETTAGKTQEEIEDIVAGLLVQGSNVTLTYNDAGNVLTIAASGGGGYSLPSQTGNAGKVLGTNGTTDSWTALPFDFVVAASDETTTITTGNGKVTFRAPVAFRLTGVKASLATASSSGLPTFRINKNAATIFSTNLSINASATTSVGATTPFVFASGASYIDFAADDVITIDFTVAGTGAKGVKITFNGLRN